MIITTVSFITVFINWYNNSLLPLSGNCALFQIERVYGSQTVIFPDAWASSAKIRSLPGDLYFLNLANKSLVLYRKLQAIAMGGDYDFIVATSLTHPGKIILAVLQTTCPQLLLPPLRLGKK
jgi:hypothetical protein